MKKYIKNEKGIALFMVMSTVSVLALLATEFIYVAQVNQKMAYEAVDQVRAHYLAKSALKISLLRLRIYQQIRENEFVKKSGLPVDQIWNFPFVYPLPALPGMTKSQKDEINKFQKNSSLDGNFTALIESESSKFNINLLLPFFKPEYKKDDKKSDPAKQEDEENPSDEKQAEAEKPEAGGQAGAQEPKFNPEEARKHFSEFLTSAFNQKKLTDENFLDKYNNYEIQPLIDNIIAWVDYTFESQSYSSEKEIPVKKAPLYDLSELHMIPLMEDELYKLFAPLLTSGVGRDINVNTVSDKLLIAFFPNLTEEQAKKIIEERDDPQKKGRFSNEDDFYKTIQPLLGWDQKTLDDEKKKFQSRNIKFITEESTFRVTVTSTANLSTQNLEAVISFLDNKKQNNNQNQPGSIQEEAEPTPEQPAPGNPENQNAGFQNKKSSIKIDLMRIL